MLEKTDVGEDRCWRRQPLEKTVVGEDMLEKLDKFWIR